ncbi:MAG: amidohydrolase, partial [Spirochaetaceae bacterium]|nr:amidohydrolase [Spirochaetaceae bacterium]
MDIIDAHVHIGIPEQRDTETKPLSFDLYNEYADFLRCMTRCGVAQAVIFPIPHKDFNTESSNEYILEASIQSKGRFIPFCRIDRNLEKNLQSGFKGVKVHLVYEDLEINRIKRELELIEAYQVPLLLHAKFKNKIPQVKEVLKYAPHLSVILAHMGRGHINTDEGIVENAEGLKKYSRVFFETSTVKDTAPHVSSINKVCAILGGSRIIFGTD